MDLVKIEDEYSSIQYKYEVRGYIVQEEVARLLELCGQLIGKSQELTEENNTLNRLVKQYQNSLRIKGRL